jgi:hypothetical protein
MKPKSRMPLIEKYAFGSMRVGGHTFYSDIVIIAEAITEWWREESHLVQPPDIVTILEEKPGVLVLGTGYSGGMRVSDEVTKLCEEKGIELIVGRTAIALDSYNKIVFEGKKTVAGAFHLTC